MDVRPGDIRRSGGLGAFAATVAAATAGCLSGAKATGPDEPPPTSMVCERPTEGLVDRIDLLLVIDNSRSMADKQQILKEAVPDLVGALVNPRCVDENDKTCKNQPQDPGAECEANCKREFEPIKDIHIGLISSSIGGHGADAGDPEKDPTQNFSVNDKAHLISRKSTQS
ncbi:MAG: hypothetical protein HY744_19260, partial [Deltaproteobacteria bacterium]|nr:hypothetical protein [Deltaproteobacteria bacterium]